MEVPPPGAHAGAQWKESRPETKLHLVAAGSPVAIWVTVLKNYIVIQTLEQLLCKQSDFEQKKTKQPKMTPIVCAHVFRQLHRYYLKIRANRFLTAMPILLRWLEQFKGNNNNNIQLKTTWKLWHPVTELLFVPAILQLQWNTLSLSSTPGVNLTEKYYYRAWF